MLGLGARGPTSWAASAFGPHSNRNDTIPTATKFVTMTMFRCPLKTFHLRMANEPSAPYSGASNDPAPLQLPSRWRPSGRTLGSRPGPIDLVYEWRKG